MLNTIAYYLGFTDNEVIEPVPPSEINHEPTFVTKETDNQWTWVDVSLDKNEGKCEVNNEYPTPPPTPKLEQSWLITPPPCFNAELAIPAEEQSPRENLLIEHPSMFVRPSVSEEEKEFVTSEPEKPLVAPAPHKKAASQSRSKRRAARQALLAISQQSKRNYQFKKTSGNVIHRNNKAMKRMRQPVHQPRKNY